ncbi:sulfurtransferase [Rossellomorea vietnamensis]|uniref:sulfurtransferase n=1 Tax=Rossellomorea vietnamensis TaxID=218284 RepID=UPI0009CE76D0|nr:thiosulfate/3-mercaptopyruvate sulfurtransferase [Bacillus sp. V-88]SLK24839.1 thiosulfate/3-mercaptopyruvate sulfurtransferase [Bacillus sp. V-88]
MRVLVDAEWLKEHMDDGDVRIIDCRFSLGNPAEGRERYNESHIPGAVFFDLEKDLSGYAKKHGGRHPLPNMKNFLRKVEDAGIDNQTTIVVYDEKEGAFAGRCWWLFHYIGHENVFILNGGFAAWKEGSKKTESSVPHYPATNYHPNVNDGILATLNEIRGIADGDRMIQLIDSRSRERFSGREEPIDRIPGHIPGAINLPWTEGMNEGYFLGSDEQNERFSKLKKDEPVIVYCGSGVTATPNFIALKEAGFTDVKLYVGSYSDWVSYEEHRVEKE